MTLFFLDFRVASAEGRVASEPTLWTRGGAWINDPGAIVGLGRSFSDFTLLIHGFNVTRSEGIAAYGAFEDRVAAKDRGTCWLGVLWPGSSSLGGPLSYPFEEGPADATAVALVSALEKGLRPRRLSMVAHSLGCRVALESMRRFTTLRCEQVTLLAGAVDADALARSDRYRASLDRTAGATVISSSRDRVLEFAFPAGDWVSSLLHDGYTRCALGRCGPEPSRTESVPSSARSVALGRKDDVGHHDYFSSDPTSSKAELVAELVMQSLA